MAKRIKTTCGYSANTDEKEKRSTITVRVFFFFQRLVYHVGSGIILSVLNINMCNAVYMFFNDSTVMPIIHGYDDLKTIVQLVKQVSKTR